MNGNEKGLSLIEVLVSLVILVIGLIGVFNLHIISKQGSFEAYQQTQAAFLAHDIINRMKTNSGNIISYSGNYPQDAPGGGNTCESLNSICSAQESVEADLFLWSQKLAGNEEVDGEQFIGGLDQAMGCITVNGNSVSVAISWKSIRESRTSIENAGQHYSGAWSCSNEGVDGNRKRLYVVNTIINGV
ncbi:type IV pilus modification protein PilV [Shewanella sp. 202IG2-18]|uniref:type IV pilus modification protein PilV n=1 Tax=Parashewanella hymeniacidonis TaxID=2807618 RepID=UPI00195F5C07|nr:type IV pilus modification protein PilV [Parashewanella hymeniacidonis]MBM7071562.1 type IV pilus modification protein PilV [Parashewanella hymeniacidonis]